MKTYDINGTTKEKFQNVTLVKSEGKIIDIITADGDPVSKRYMLTDQHLVIKEYDAIYEGKDVKIFSVTLPTNEYFSIFVSSYGGNIVSFPKGKDGKKAAVFARWIQDVYNRKIFALHSNDFVIIIDASGKMINQGWASMYTNKYDNNRNLMILTYPKESKTEAINLEKGISLGVFDCITITIDNNHLIVSENMKEKLIDLDGKTKIKLSDDIGDESFKTIRDGKEITTYYYIVSKNGLKLYDSDFNETIDLSKNNLTIKKIKRPLGAAYLVVFDKSSTKVNILGTDLKPMFDTWLDDIVYDYFNGVKDHMFLCKSQKGYTIMNGDSLLPMEGFPEYIEGITPLYFSSVSGIEYYGIRIGSGECKIFRCSPMIDGYYTFILKNLEIEDILVDDLSKIYISSGGKTAMLLPRGKFMSIMECDGVMPTYSKNILIVTKNGKFNFMKSGKGCYPMYFKEYVDNLYDIECRFIIVNNDGKYAYFDTTKFDLFDSGEGIWWDDVEPAYEENDRLIFKVKDTDGKWIEL